MLLNRWEPWTELNRLGRDMEQLFNGRGHGTGSASEFGSHPALNIWEDSDNLYVEAELPGFDLDAMEIYVTCNQLMMKGERRPPEETEGVWHRQERAFGKFKRVIELPDQVDGDKVSAEFRNGVLTVTLPKCEAIKPRRIEVKSSES